MLLSDKYPNLDLNCLIIYWIMASKCNIVWIVWQFTCRFDRLYRIYVLTGTGWPAISYLRTTHVRISYLRTTCIRISYLRTTCIHISYLRISYIVYTYYVYTYIVYTYIVYRIYVYRIYVYRIYVPHTLAL